MKLNILCLRSLVIQEAERVRAFNETLAETYDGGPIQSLLEWALTLERPCGGGVELERLIFDTMKDEGIRFADFREYGYLRDNIREDLRCFRAEA